MLHVVAVWLIVVVGWWPRADSKLVKNKYYHKRANFAHWRVKILKFRPSGIKPREREAPQLLDDHPTEERISDSIVISLLNSETFPHSRRD